jgi:extradiol dioxygenase family protein
MSHPGVVKLTPFHLAFPVRDVEEARRFYGGLLECPEGRSDTDWVDFDFFGHQLSIHLVDGSERVATNPVDGDDVPASHFGIILPWLEWEQLRDRLIAAEVVFRIAPRVRFQGEVGEQATMFFDDPSGNALEFKAFRDPSQIFAR